MENWEVLRSHYRKARQESFKELALVQSHGRRELTGIGNSSHLHPVLATANNI